MLRAVRFNRAGAPPQLNAYLSRRWAARHPATIGATRVIFVPVGLRLRDADTRRLRRPTPWNATLVRTLTLTRRRLNLPFIRPFF